LAAIALAFAAGMPSTAAFRAAGFSFCGGVSLFAALVVAIAYPRRSSISAAFSRTQLKMG
jgi:hypothetical protein